VLNTEDGGRAPKQAAGPASAREQIAYVKKTLQGEPQGTLDAGVFCTGRCGPTMPRT